MDASGDDVFVAGIKRVAPMLRKCDRDEHSGFFFDLITQAIIWNDELPKPSERGLENFWGMRPVFRYRTSLLLGKPEPEWEPYWLLARNLFPSWVGFTKERLEATPEVLEFLRDNRDRLIRELGSLGVTAFFAEQGVDIEAKLRGAE